MMGSYLGARMMPVGFGEGGTGGVPGDMCPYRRFGSDLGVAKRMERGRMVKRKTLV